jgi:O-antigen ligase
MVLAVTSFGRPLSVGRLSIDAVVIMVPVTILLCLPYVRRIGLSAVPPYVLGPVTLVFLVCSLASFVANGGQPDSLLTVVRYASYVLLVMTIAVVTQDTAVRRLLLWSIAITGALTAVLALAQYLDPKLTPGMNGIGPEITTRVVGTFYNSNFYAEYLILVIGVIVALLFTEGVLGRVIAALSGVIVSVALLLTYTRGSWIGIVVGLVIVVIIVDMRYLLLVAAAGAAGILLVPGVTARLSQSQSNQGSAQFRVGLWKVAGEAMRTHPVFGDGPGNFYGAYREVITVHPELFAGYLFFGAHNAYFELTAEIGILGGLAYFVLTLLFATRGLYIATREGVDHDTKFIALGLSAGLIAFVVNSFTSDTFQHPQSGLFFWILAGVVAGLGASLWQAPIRSDESAGLGTEGLVGGSAATHAVSGVRAYFHRAWRASLFFHRFAEPGDERGNWLTSSRVIRAIFGSGPGDTPQGS